MCIRDRVIEYHFELIVARQDHVLVELYGSIRTAENEIAVSSQGAWGCVEMVRLQSLFFGPVMECLFGRIEGGHTVFCTQEDISFTIGQ